MQQGQRNCVNVLAASATAVLRTAVGYTVWIMHTHPMGNINKDYRQGTGQCIILR